MPDPKDSRLDALLQENRLFPPPEEFRKNAIANDPEIYDRARTNPEGFWEEEARKLDWFATWQKSLRMERSVGQMVCRRQDQRHLQLRGPSRRLRAPQQGRVGLGRRARRLAHLHLRHVGARSK